MRSKWWAKVEKQMIIIALNLVKQLECHGVTSFLECQDKKRTSLRLEIPQIKDCKLSNSHLMHT